MSALSNEEIVAAFLKKIDGLTLREAQDLTAEVLGSSEKIDHQTIGNYRTGRWKRLFPRARRKLEQFLDLIPATESHTYAAGVEYVADRLAELVDDLGRISGRAAPMLSEGKEASTNDPGVGQTGPEALKLRFLAAISQFTDLQVEELCGLNHESVRQYRAEWPRRGPNRASTKKMHAMIERHEAILEENAIIAREKIPENAAGLIKMAEYLQNHPSFSKKHPNLGWISFADAMARHFRDLGEMSIYDELVWLGYKIGVKFDPGTASRVTLEDADFDVSQFLGAGRSSAGSDE